MKKTKDSTITTFLKDNCANYDRYYQSCLFADSCKVFDGQRCGYFERYVLGPPDYKFKLPGYDYAKLFAQYAELTKTKKQAVKVRRCDCGEPVGYRQRLCEKCMGLKRRDSYRKYRNSKKDQAPQLTAF